MKTRIALLVLTLMLNLASFAADSKPAASSTNAVTAFERLKTLVGEWEADTSMGKEHARFELASNGHVIIERSNGPEGDMTTTYYLDGDKIGATHYCALGNQPRLQASGYRR